MGSLEGKTALITGATAGIGFYTAVGLAKGGARVLVTARHEPRGRSARQKLPLFVASSPNLGRLSGRYFDGVKEKRLPQPLLDTAVQDRAWDLGESFISRTLGSHEFKA